MTNVGQAPPARPDRGRFWVAAITPLWFAWRGRYLELLLCWAGYTAINWQAILLSQGWVLSDALRLGALSLLFPLLFTGMPTPVVGDGVPMVWTLGMIAAQAGWAWAVGRRQPRLARPVRAAGLLAVFGVVVWCFFGLSVPGTKPRAYVTAMRDDLRELWLAQEQHRADHYRYQAVLDSLGIQLESAVFVEMVSADSIGWSARARHNGTSATCAIFVGSADPLIPGSADGEPACVRPAERPRWSRVDLTDRARETLQRLAASQDSFRAATGRYGTLAELGFAALNPQPIVQLNGDSGWSAIMDHFLMRGRWCAVAGGTSANPASHRVEVAVRCQRR